MIIRHLHQSGKIRGVNDEYDEDFMIIAGGGMNAMWMKLYLSGDVVDYVGELHDNNNQFIRIHGKDKIVEFLDRDEMMKIFFSWEEKIKRLKPFK